MLSQAMTELSPSAESGELHKKSTIAVFAIEDLVTKTSEDHVTAQGFGYSSPLETPQQSNSITCRWEGMIHPTPLQEQKMVKAYNVRDTIQELAANFAQHYRDHSDATLQAQGEPSYALSFVPTEEQIAELMQTNPDVQRVVRGLKPEEQAAFMLAFSKANSEALKQK